MFKIFFIVMLAVMDVQCTFLDHPGVRTLSYGVSSNLRVWSTFVTPRSTEKFLWWGDGRVEIREYCMRYRRPGFLAVKWCGSSPTPSTPSPVRKWHLFLCVTGRVELTDGRGGEGWGVEPNYATTRKPDPLYIIQYSLVETKYVKGTHTDR